MRIIISPAKKMREDTDSFAALGLPDFLDKTEVLLAALREKSYDQLRALWKCADGIARQNMERLEKMDLRRGLSPALFAYEGIQYQYMAPGVMGAGELEYLQQRLRILSGFYGMLRPFDGVRPYRLEMQAKLAVPGARDLYSFWGEELARRLSSESDWVLNLASKEYSRAVTAYLPAESVLTCVFGERAGGRVVEKGTMCKMARGQMVRWLAENKVDRREDIKEFSDLDYSFDQERENQFIFIKKT